VKPSGNYRYVCVYIHIFGTGWLEGVVLKGVMSMKIERDGETKVFCCSLNRYLPSTVI
jgi:hypothetical protein